MPEIDGVTITERPPFTSIIPASAGSVSIERTPKFAIIYGESQLKVDGPQQGAALVQTKVITYEFHVRGDNPSDGGPWPVLRLHHLHGLAQWDGLDGGGHVWAIASATLTRLSDGVVIYDKLLEDRVSLASPANSTLAARG